MVTFVVFFFFFILLFYLENVHISSFLQNDGGHLLHKFISKKRKKIQHQFSCKVLNFTLRDYV